MDEAILERFAEGGAAAVHPTVRGWSTRAELVANLRLALAGEVRLVGDAASARALAAAFPVPGCGPEQYGNRVLEAPGGLGVLAGIRFRPSAGGAAWVDVVATSRPVAGVSEWKRLFRRLAAEFAGFAPKWVGFFTADDDPAFRGRLAGDLVLAARLDDLRAASRARPGPVTLAPVAAAACLAAYERTYAEFHAEAAGNADLAQAEDLATLRRFEADGGLFEIVADGAPAGWCAARRSSRFGVRGWVGGEILLRRQFRGRGLAAEAHLRMGAALPALAGEAIWAMVHDENAPSRRAGLRAGYLPAGRVVRVATSP